MRRIHRVLRESMSTGVSYVPVYVLHVGCLFLFMLLWMEPTGGLVQIKGTLLTHLWMLAVLVTECVVWILAVRRGRTTPGTGGGIVLAAFGLLCRVWCDVLVFGTPSLSGLVYHGESAIERHPSATLQFLIGVHRHGGLLAFVLGLALTAWAITRDSRRARLGVSG